MALEQNDLSDMEREITVKDIPTNIICQDALQYIKSIKEFPDKVKEFINRFPCAAGLYFAVGAEAVDWIPRAVGHGMNVINDGMQYHVRVTGFPLWKLYLYGKYRFEIELLGVLGFNYGLDYLSRNGVSLDADRYGDPTECIRDYKKQLDKNESWYTVRSEEYDNLAIKITETLSNIKMLEESTGSVPEILAEKLAVYRHIADCNYLVLDDKRLSEFSGKGPYRYILHKDVVYGSDSEYFPDNA